MFVKFFFSIFFAFKAPKSHLKMCNPINVWLGRVFKSYFFLLTPECCHSAEAYTYCVCITERAAGVTQRDKHFVAASRSLHWPSSVTFPGRSSSSLSVYKHTSLENNLSKTFHLIQFNEPRSSPASSNTHFQARMKKKNPWEGREGGVLLTISNTFQSGFNFGRSLQSISIRPYNPLLSSPHPPAWDRNPIDAALHHWGRTPHDSLSQGEVHTTQLLIILRSTHPEIGSTFQDFTSFNLIGRQNKKVCIATLWIEVSFHSRPDRNSFGLCYHFHFCHVCRQRP